MKAVFLIWGAERTQIEMTFPKRPQMATPDDTTPSVQNRHGLVTFIVQTYFPSGPDLVKWPHLNLVRIFVFSKMML